MNLTNDEKDVLTVMLTAKISDIAPLISTRNFGADTSNLEITKRKYERIKNKFEKAVG